MNKAQKIAAAWSALSARELTEQVRHLVKARDAAARATWAAVREDPVLAARARGALAGLKAEFRGHRDEGMWLLWIAQAQQQLAAPTTSAQAPAPKSTVDSRRKSTVDAGANPAVDFLADAAVDARTDSAVDSAPVLTAPVVVAPQRRASAPAVLFQEPLGSTAN
ncbi:hypothetical protein [Saccharothrix coeruleofusca]|uniref:Uncharacterized protein n=1 Tax=Saccharothrix coeruleofusca TaxID=33919 RepID=A0A918EH40_9PSEU|nr:hypothetical protein [Saccharothrix coeruleofusca]MBP2336719.1 hypothetical protein [Saccharothrix coeruleofusca]GGP78519.1 hypothetical protein GCM10010185_60390 [Saccharothrix coeruleofusca]